MIIEDDDFILIEDNDDFHESCHRMFENQKLLRNQIKELQEQIRVIHIEIDRIKQVMK